ncbi:MAG: FprA family A-type flavoprotein [Euryarchaeota archaeon]|nr:FprA family A-type flavoprotein [Euryarchaeota archaeon]
MPPHEVRPGITWVGAVDWDRRLFDELIPLPDGTSYNSYLVKGSQKAALIDTVNPNKGDELVSNLQKLGVKRIDYIISHHGEQDHSGSIPRILELYPEAKVVTNEKCKELLKILLHVSDDKFHVVKDREALSLGDRTLEFIIAPWVHWPETMLTYLREERILFPCDFLGSHLATSELYAVDEAKVLDSAKRYYAEIMMPFRPHIKKHFEVLSGYKIDMVAPSHGPIYNRPALIIDAYKDWISEVVKNEVVLAYVSMHGSTRLMAQHLTDALIVRGVHVKPFNLTVTDIGELAKALVEPATLVLASPTVLGGAHPLAIYAAYLANALKPKVRFATLIGSYGWGTRAVEQVTGMLGNLKVELYEPVLVKGKPRNEDYEKLDRLADQILDRHKGAGLVK